MTFDEMRGQNGTVRRPYAGISRWLQSVSTDQLEGRCVEAELFYRRGGITFAVHGDAQGEERIIPYDIVPRVLSVSEWARLSRGLEQRVRALNLYLADIYGNQEILKAGVVPQDLVWRNPAFRPEMCGLKVPHGIYVHIAGIDIVRIDADSFFVLEDNARVPSGVSYMLGGREISIRLMPDLFSAHRVAPIENYPDELLATLRSVGPAGASAGTGGLRHRGSGELEAELARYADDPANDQDDERALQRDDAARKGTPPRGRRPGVRFRHGAENAPARGPRRRAASRNARPPPRSTGSRPRPVAAPERTSPRRRGRRAGTLRRTGRPGARAARSTHRAYRPR